MHSRSNSSAEVTIKRVQGPQVDLPWGHIRRVLKGQSQNQIFLGNRLFDQLRGKAVISALRDTMRLHDPEQETETLQFTVKVVALLVTVPALLLTTTSYVAPLSVLVVAGVV